MLTVLNVAVFLFSSCVVVCRIIFLLLSFRENEHQPSQSSSFSFVSSFLSVSIMSLCGAMTFVISVSIIYSWAACFKIYYYFGNKFVI